MDIEFGNIMPVAPKDILRRLWQYDPRLHLNFNAKIKTSTIQGCWQLWRTSELTGRKKFLFNILNEDGSYRPIDSSIFLDLDKGKYYAEHPELLHKIAVDNLLDERARQEKKVHDNVAHLAKDRSLKKRFEQVRELAASVSEEEWKTARYLKNKDGSIATDAHGEPVKWVPHESLKQ